MLHPLCGRPLVGWPIAAAREAGARADRRRRLARRPLDEPCPTASTGVVQPPPNGTGGAVRPRRASRRRADVVVIPGDVPLVTAAAISGARRRPRGERRRRDHGHDAPRRPRRLRPRRPRRRRRRRAASSRPRPTATPRPSSSDQRGQQLDLRVRRRGADERAAALTPDNAQRELYLPDVLPALRAAGRTVAAHALADPDVALGVNDRVQLAQVRAIAQRRIHDAHGRAGVTIVDPASTLIDVDGDDRRGHDDRASSSLRGATRIGEGCTVGPLTTLIDATLHDDVTIPHSYVVERRDRGRRDRRAVRLPAAGHAPAPDSKAGTFVEIKNSDVGAGTRSRTSPTSATRTSARTRTSAPRRSPRTTTAPKAPHDDRRPGPHRRGHDARRPRDARRRHLDGANSAITKDVPDKALGIARERQTNYEGYADRRRRTDN